MKVRPNRIKRKISHVRNGFHLEAVKHLTGLNLFFHARGAEILYNRAPDSTRLIELIDLTAAAGRLRQKRCAADVCLARSGKPADELERDGKRLVRAVHRRDFQGGEVETFPEHVDADDSV